MTKIRNKLAYCTTREAAAMLGISLRTAQLWVDSGLLDAWRTEGGHRRITLESVNRLRQTNGAGTTAIRTKAGHPVLAATGPLPLRVLIAQDDNILMRLYRMRLEGWQLPIQVSTAANAYEALMRIGREFPDLLITDLKMRGLDGSRMVQSLLTSSYREGLEIIVLTNPTPEELAAVKTLPETISVLTKPVPITELRALIEQMIARRAPCNLPESCA